jgi:hypothetical protein
MRVLFVSGIDGACHRYQVLHRARQVHVAGGAAMVRSFVDPDLAAELRRHDVLFLYRVPWSDRTRSLVGQARAARQPVVGAIDDLVFDPAAESLPSLSRLSGAERALWLDGVARYRVTLEACDAVVAPTDPLVERARSFGWPAHLHRNALSEPERAVAAQARAAARREAHAVVLGYAAGTPTHDEDLARIAQALAALLSARPQTRLALLGPVALPDALAPFRDRVRRGPRVAWTDLCGWLAAIDVNLAPLDLERRFARATSRRRRWERRRWRARRRLSRTRSGTARTAPSR